MNTLFHPDALPRRRGSNSVKWDSTKSRFGEADLLPVWVADMDFPSPPCVIDALLDAVKFGIYGYYAPPDSYMQAFLKWEKRMHHAEIQPEWVRFTPGVVTGIYWAINALTQPADGILILTPCYYPFMDAVIGNDRKLVCCDLVNQAGCYTIDLEAFERCIREEHVRMFLLCSPHNPVGRVWTPEELSSMFEICRKYQVYVVSDEIHQDITFGCRHCTSLNAAPDYEKLVLLTAASKTFNLAGFQNSFAVIPNDQVRNAFDGYVKRLRIKKGVFMGYIATEAAFNGGEPWLRETLPFIEENFHFLRHMLTEAYPAITVTPLEGTYMCWVDLGAYVPAQDLQLVVQTKARLAVDYGNWFWPDRQTDTHIRINIAAARSTIEQTGRQLVHAIAQYLK